MSGQESRINLPYDIKNAVSIFDYSKGLLEFGGKIFRVFFIFDEGEIIVLFNGFQKKTQKTPPSEIERAIKIKEAYYADKQSQNR